MSLPGDPPRSLARNFAWSGLAQGWNLGLSVASVMVIARLLPPHEYAVLAVVTPLIAMSYVVQSLGMNSAIILAKTVTKRQLNTLFWIGLALSVVIAMTLMLTAPVLARVFADPRLTPALTLAALSPMLVALGAQPSALLMRDLRFREIAIRSSAAISLGTGVSVVLAYHSRSHWALIGGMLVLHGTNTLLGALLARWRPGLPGPLAEVLPLLRFGLSVWAANLFNFAARHADNLIVAAATTPRHLGLYDRAYRVLLGPIEQAVLPLGQVLVPTLSRCTDDPERYRSHYWRAVAVLLFAVHPLLALATIDGATLVGLLLGPLWLDAAPLFGWFAATGLFQTFLATLDWLLVSQGRGGTYLRKNLLTSLVALVSFAIGIRWGIKGVAVAYALGQGVLCAPFALWLVGRNGLIRHGELLRGLMPFALALGAALAVIAASRAAFGSPLWPLLLVTGVAAYSAYLAARAGTLLSVAARRLA